MSTGEFCAGRDRLNILPLRTLVTVTMNQWRWQPVFYFSPAPPPLIPTCGSREVVLEREMGGKREREREREKDYIERKWETGYTNYDDVYSTWGTKACHVCLISFFVFFLFSIHIYVTNCPGYIAFLQYIRLFTKLLLNCLVCCGVVAALTTKEMKSIKVCSFISLCCFSSDQVSDKTFFFFFFFFFFSIL
jgi:hypothetical protein